MYEGLTGLLPDLEDAARNGKWAVLPGRDGVGRQPSQSLAVGYEQVVIDLEDAIYRFEKSHPELGLGRYQEILQRRGIDWSVESISQADANSLDGQAVAALILAAVRAERFCEGALLEFCRNGSVLRWLRRLGELDATAQDPPKGEASVGELNIAEVITRLYDIVGDLERRYPGRRFTPDGHLVGSLGEVYAAERYGLTLYRGSHPVHDGETNDGRRVQIKATQGTKVGLTHEPDHLIVLHISKEGHFDEVYNGPGHTAWEACGKMQSNGQRQISLSRLRMFDGDVEDADRVSAIES